MVPIAHYFETVPNISNGTMFGDLDWPLNASRGLSVIAEFLVLCYDVEDDVDRLRHSLL